jgi:hypothetical protein
MTDNVSKVEKNITASKNRLSLVVFWIIIALIIGTNVKYKHWENKNKIIYVDVLHYYAYLPATFIHHDLTLKFTRTNNTYYSQYFWPRVLPNDNLIILTTMGMSYMYAPFFIAVHYPLKWIGEVATGYSPPYKIALIISCIFWFTIGLYFLRKLLLRYFSDQVTAFTLIAIVLATNLFYYTTDEPAMSHAYSFALYALFICFVDSWFKKPKTGYSIAIGFLIGVIALIRPSNAVIVVLLLFWGVDSFKSLGERLKLFIRQYPQVLIMLAATILTWIPQVIYWKYVSGHYFVFTYGEKGKFFFDNPQFFRVLMGFRKGWLIYTPIMVLALVGFIPLWKKYKSIFWPVALFFIFNLWIVCSWWLWWYGGSYGMRALIESYAIMALPMAAFFSWITQHNKLKGTVLASGIVLFFAAHNFFQITQYHTGAIDAIRMTRQAYISSFMKLHPTAQLKKCLVYPDYAAAAFGKYPKPVMTDSLYLGLLDKEHSVKLIEKEIRSGEESMNMMQQKATARNISIDSAIILDANYLYKSKVENGEIPKNPRKFQIFDWWY